ncbi:MAG TPA: UDP-N-acetylmuramoyl-L-alanine--D-glutamate ligase [Methylomirabilota bacterium]|nr:UDP-N-acetylmuramoyl-L-alanine--D-glutamate ligase [Methylomirabilota bacterium]
MELRDKTVLVIGLRRTGVSVARFVASRGGRVRIADRLSAAALTQELESLSGIPLEERLGRREADADVVAGVDLVVPSPGVPMEAPLLREAEKQGVPIWSEIELAFRFLSCPVLAVTGTNGKSTTTSLLGEMVKQNGQRVFVGGNLGVPLIDAAMDRYDVAVAEVSSFQLEWVAQFRPRIGVFLNLTEDHLDRHKSLAVYGMTKRAMLTNQKPSDWAVVNRDDPEVWSLAHGLPGKIFSFGWRPVAEGAWIESGVMHIKREGQMTSFPLDQLRLHGRHNLENVMAAASAALLWGVRPDVIASVLAAFTGLPHRLEFVAEKGGVRYFDDSKGTNVGAVVQSLASFPGPVILLAGGVDKGGDYSPLRPLVREKVKRLIVFGQARELIRNALGCETRTLIVETLADAVQEAAAAATPGDTVLLSPACASFDQFNNYAHRGDVFRACVEELPV